MVFSITEEGATGKAKAILKPHGYDMISKKEADRAVKAAVLIRPGVIEIEDRPRPMPGPGEVLVRIRSVGVCGSDIHYYRHGRIGRFIVEKPLILGHESAGEIVEVGEGVRSLGPGDRVSIEPGIPCRRCALCKSGRYNLCPDVRFMATPPVDGAFAEYVAVPEDFAFKLPENLSYEEGALIEPLAVGLHAVRRAGVRPQENCLILGTGPIGLVTLQAARAYGADPVIAADISDFRLSVAGRLGATRTINMSDPGADERIREAIGEGAHVVFETAGVPATIRKTVQFTRTGGRVVLIGLSPRGIEEYDVGEAISKELNIMGVFRYANVYAEAIRLAAAGRIDLRSMVTHKFPLERVKDALEFADLHKNECIKAVVNVD